MTVTLNANLARAASTPAKSPAISQQALRSFVLQPVCVVGGKVQVAFTKIRSGV